MLEGIVLIVISLVVIFLSLQQFNHSRPASNNEPEEEPTPSRPAAAEDPKLECWVCPSCSQYNRTDVPYFLDQIRCQNCYTIKPERVEYHPITLSSYWDQARFGHEADRRNAEKAKRRPWIDPSIAPKGTGKHRIEFEPPKKQMPDDLKDKISRN